MTELKRCPFCGGEARIREVSIGDYFDGFSVDCRNCAVDIGNFDTKEEAIKEWNKRSNPWYTGKPIEEGWYLVAYECVYECRNKGKLEYHTMHILEDEFGYKDIRGRASDDVWKAVAWQKITPYKEKEDGRTD